MLFRVCVCVLLLLSSAWKNFNLSNPHVCLIWNSYSDHHLWKPFPDSSNWIDHLKQLLNSLTLICNGLYFFAYLSNSLKYWPKQNIKPYWINNLLLLFACTKSTNSIIVLDRHSVKFHSSLNTSSHFSLRASQVPRKDIIYLTHTQRNELSNYLLYSILELFSKFQSKLFHIVLDHLSLQK